MVISPRTCAGRDLRTRPTRAAAEDHAPEVPLTERHLDPQCRSAAPHACGRAAPITVNVFARLERCSG
jgi:hypothetical protein